MDEVHPIWPTGTEFTYATWHFHRNLWERYGIRLLPGEFARINTLIVSGELQPMPRQGYRGLRVYKYLHQPGTNEQRRIYIVADPTDGRLVSVMKSDWVKPKKKKKFRKHHRR